jgi:hypothetical protein
MEPEGIRKAWISRLRMIRAMAAAQMMDSDHSRYQGFFLRW